MRRRQHLGLAAAALLSAALPVRADTFPSRPIKLVVPFNPGGALDTLARKLSPGLAARLGQQVIVENKPGGNTIIASQYVANAAPDGYTLYLTLSAPYSMLPSLYKKPLPYDAQNGYTAIGLAANIIYGLVVGTSRDIKSVPEYVDFAKKNPGTLTYGSTGSGQALSLSMELMKARLGIDVLHVPFTGQAPVFQALLSGQVDSALMDVGLAEQYVKSGRLRMLAVIGDGRISTLPNIPTMREAGVPLDIPPLWIGFVGPKGLPAPIVAALNDALNHEMRSPQLTPWLTSVGLAPLTGTPHDLASRISAETAIWSRIIGQFGISLD